jgi:hypothetical protein
MSNILTMIKSSKGLRALVAASMVLGMLAPLSNPTLTYASSVTSAAFSGGSGTVSVGGILYAKNGAALTLTVTTSSDTKCVDVTGAHTGHQTSSTAKSSWTFSGAAFTAGAGDGVRTITAAASPNFNTNTNNCTGQTGTGTASYTLDNTGPVVTAALSPAANAAGWNNANVTITWSATDAGSGIANGGGPTPATDSQNGNTAGVTKTATATDRVGNVGNGSVTIMRSRASRAVVALRYCPAAVPTSR